MTFYSGLASTTNRLLRKFGASATLKRVTEGAYDPALGTATVTTTSYAIVAAVFDIDQGDIDGTVIKMNDKRAYISTLTGIPLPISGDRIVWNGVEYSILGTGTESEPAVKDLSPGGTSVLYEVILRR